MRLLEHAGEKLTIAEWAKRYGLTPQALRFRLKNPNLTPEQVFCSQRMKRGRKRK